LVGLWISGEARVVENEDRNGPVANGGDGGKGGTIIRRGEEKKEMMEEMRVGIDGGMGVFNNRRLRQSLGVEKESTR
jgi:GTPase involved in cell partitioning and DNA repair